MWLILSRTTAAGGACIAAMKDAIRVGWERIYVHCQSSCLSLSWPYREEITCRRERPGTKGARQGKEPGPRLDMPRSEARHHHPLGITSLTLPQAACSISLVEQQPEPLSKHRGRQLLVTHGLLHGRSPAKQHGLAAWQASALPLLRARADGARLHQPCLLVSARLG